MEGVYSSRKMEQLCRNHIQFILLLDGMNLRIIAPSPGSGAARRPEKPLRACSGST